MNLTEASDVTTILKAVYIDGTPEAIGNARPAAVRLATRIEHPLSDSGRPFVRPADIEQLRMSGPLEAVGAGPLIDPDCRDDKCGSCVGGPCEHGCHQPLPAGEGITGMQWDNLGSADHG